MKTVWQLFKIVGQLLVALVLYLKFLWLRERFYQRVNWRFRFQQPDVYRSICELERLKKKKGL